MSIVNMYQKRDRLAEELELDSFLEDYDYIDDNSKRFRSQSVLDGTAAAFVMNTTLGSKQ